jgi:hypothetical protein
MKPCPYCGYSNYAYARTCRKCETPLVATPGTVYRPDKHLIGPARGRSLRSQALFLIVVGLAMKIYWGGYGSWPTIDNPTLAGIRAWLQPLLLWGGAILYLLGWILRSV